MQPAVSMLLIGALVAVVTHAKKSHHLLQKNTLGLVREMGVSRTTGFGLNLVATADQSHVQAVSANGIPGWVQMDTILAPATCNSTEPAPVVMGYVTNTCLYSMDEDQEISYLFTCRQEADMMSATVFKSPNCDTTTVGFFTSIPLGCNTDPAEGAPSYRYSCTTSSTAQLEDEYILTEQYADDQCSGPIFMYTGILNNYCLMKNETSTAYVYPNIVFYPDSGDCNGTEFSAPLPSPDQCIDLDDNSAREFATRDQAASVEATNNPTSSLRGPKHLRDQQTNHLSTTSTKRKITGDSADVNAYSYYNADGYYYSYSYYDDAPDLSFPYGRAVLASNVSTSSSAIPMPTFLPTSSPTVEVDQTLRYTVYQVLNNIDAATYQADWTVNNEVISSTVATYMSGVLSENVNVLSVQNSVSTTVAGEMRIASTSTQVTYTVYIPSTASAGYANGMDAYTSTTASLNASLVSGAFTSTMQATAVSQGAAGLVNATSSQATASSPQMNNESGDDDDNGLSHGVIITIAVVCSVGVFGLVVGVVLYTSRLKSAKADEAKVVASRNATPSHPSQAGGADPGSEGMEMGQMGAVVVEISPSPVKLGASV